MTVESIAGPVTPRRNGWFARETLLHSTSTTLQQALALTTELSQLVTGTGNGATATGFTRNVWTLSTASAVEGQNKCIILAASGETSVYLGGGTATGRWVLTETDDTIHARYLNGKWRLIAQSGATLASAT